MYMYVCINVYNKLYIYTHTHIHITYIVIWCSPQKEFYN